MHRDVFATVAVWAAALSVTGIFVWLLADIVAHGIAGLSWSFLTEAPSHAGRAGGIGPIIVATGLIVAVAVAASAPLGLATAVLLAEFTRSGHRFGRFVRHSLDVLAGVPSIVFGLFGNAFFCVYLGLGFSILSGGMTLACMALPILIRTAEEGLRAVPNDYRLTSAALGLSRTSALVHL
ncbi:MAG: PstA family ABC transporter permease, partial [Gammaproteobacteria bacterium]